MNNTQPYVRTCYKIATLFFFFFFFFFFFLLKYGMKISPNTYVAQAFRTHKESMPTQDMEDTTQTTFFCCKECAQLGEATKWITEYLLYLLCAAKKK